METSNYLTSNQHGFRKSYSTTSATSKFIEDIILNLDERFHTAAVFFGSKKAFDTIDHKILIGKLKHAGLGPNTLILLGKYLSNRKQSVLYKGKYPELKSLPTGITQGSTLGSLMFLLYINDLPQI